MKLLKHTAVILAALFVLLGIPALKYHVPALLFGGADAVSRATMDIPDQPSGEFVVFMQEAPHRDTMDQWRIFFTGGDAGVIMSDIRCMAAASDPAGVQMAQRCQARLPENQMKLRLEEATLLASKAECGRFDVIILSREIADALKLRHVYDMDGVAVIAVKGD